MTATVKRLDWLALAAGDPDGLARYYRDQLGLEQTDDQSIAGPPTAASFAAPPGRLCIRPHTAMPSGGVHTHFAVSVTTERYEWLLERLRDTGPVSERTFGGNRSLYRHDPAGNCVEFGERDGFDGRVGPIFEVVLEVPDLEVALDRYQALGFTPDDGSATRPRRRLFGPFDLELWEPHLGIADARGGCHVDIGVTVDDPRAAATVLVGAEGAGTWEGDRLFVRDPAGHTWWLGAP